MFLPLDIPSKYWISKAYVSLAAFTISRKEHRPSILIPTSRAMAVVTLLMISRSPAKSFLMEEYSWLREPVSTRRIIPFLALTHSRYCLTFAMVSSTAVSMGMSMASNTKVRQVRLATFWILLAVESPWATISPWNSMVSTIYSWRDRANRKSRAPPVSWSIS